MEKFEILKELNSCPYLINEASNCIYHHKTFAIVRSNGIDTFYKTKKGAEGQIKRDCLVSYYDEMTMTMCDCGFDKTIMEIKETEIPDINDKAVWYRHIEHLFKKNWLQTNDTVWEVKKYSSNQDTINFVIELITKIKNDNYLSMPIYKEYEYKEEEEQVKEVKETEAALKVENNNNDIVVSFNEEKNGIEIKFNCKPSEEVRTELKDNGFKWSRFNKIWWAKDSKQRREFLINKGYLKENNEQNEEVETITNEIASEPVETVNTIEPAKKDYESLINENIATYKISEELNRRVNSVSFMVSNRDYNKDLKKFLNGCKDEVLKVINMTNDITMKEKVLSYITSFNKKYFENYTRILNHKANNPSWVVTGRGGLNKRKYDKALSRYDNLLLDNSNLVDSFNNKISKFRNDTKRAKRREINNKIDNFTKTNNSKIKFEKVKVKICCSNVTDIFNNGTYEVNAYYCNKYYIIKNWGCWRIYNEKGNEIAATRTNTTLKAAKEYLTYLLSNVA